MFGVAAQTICDVFRVVWFVTQMSYQKAFINGTMGKDVGNTMCIADPTLGFPCLPISVGGPSLPPPTRALPTRLVNFAPKLGNFFGGEIRR
jgi:hypothetical protein